LVGGVVDSMCGDVEVHVTDKLVYVGWDGGSIALLRGKRRVYMNVRGKTVEHGVKYLRDNLVIVSVGSSEFRIEYCDDEPCLVTKVRECV